MSSALQDAITHLFGPDTPIESSEEVNEACRRYLIAIRDELGLPPNTPGAEVMRLFGENTALVNEVKALIRKIRGEE